MSEMTAPANETSDQTLLWRAVAAQTRAELTLTMRRGENILITIIVPVILLVFFAALGVPGVEHDATVSFLLPGILALAIIATGMVNLGIATAYERYYGVLKRLGASPLPRGGLLLAKAAAVLALEVVQVALLVAIAAAAWGWRWPAHSAPRRRWPRPTASTSASSSSAARSSPSTTCRLSCKVWRTSSP